MSVKPYLTDPANIDPDLENTIPETVPGTVLDENAPIQEPEKENVQAQSRRRGRPRKYPLHANIADITVFLRDSNNEGNTKNNRYILVEAARLFAINHRLLLLSHHSCQ